MSSDGLGDVNTKRRFFFFPKQHTRWRAVRDVYPTPRRPVDARARDGMVGVKNLLSVCRMTPRALSGSRHLLTVRLLRLNERSVLHGLRSVESHMTHATNGADATLADARLFLLSLRARFCARGAFSEVFLGSARC